MCRAGTTLRRAEQELPLVVEAYWRQYRLANGSRPERLEAADWLWACDALHDAVRGPSVQDALQLLDALLAHPDADAVYVGAGLVEDVLNRPDVEDWDEELARRCRDSPAWRQAVQATVPPDGLRLPSTSRYLPQPPSLPKAGKTSFRKKRRERSAS